jgi:hypothetical protein
MKESTFKKQASQKQLGKFAGNSSQSKSQKKDVKNTGIKNLSLSSQRKVMKVLMIKLILEFGIIY